MTTIKTEQHQSGCATWHEAMQEQFDLLHTPMPSDPRDAIKRLIQLETAIALDPNVSEQANALVQRGRTQALDEAAELAQTNGIDGIPIDSDDIVADWLQSLKGKQ